MKCSFCGSEINDGDKFCMVCGTAVSAAAAAPVQQAEAEPSVQPDVSAMMPEVSAPDIPEVTVNIPGVDPSPAVSDTPAPDTVASSEGQAVTEQPAGGAYFSDQAGAMFGNVVGPAPQVSDQNINVQPQAAPAYDQMQGQSVYAQPQAAPAYDQMQGQNAYAQPQGMPAYNQMPGQNMYAQPQGMPVYAQPVYMGPDPLAESLSKTSLVMGIISLVLGLSIYFSIGGIVLGAMGLAKSNEYVAKFGKTTGKGLVGRLLSRAGLITGIVFTAALALVLIIVLAEEYL